jgi:hypothetical protein
MGTAANVATTPAVAAGEVAFTARLMVLATLPHSDPGDGVREWTRRNGDFLLGIQAGIDKGIPYGSYPRLVLAWLCTEAVITRRRDIVLGDSLRAFMAGLGLTVSGGKRGTVPALRDQMTRLFSARVSAVYSPENGKGWGFESVEVANKAALWWDDRKPDQAQLWQSTVTLGERLFEEILAAPVPIDARILREIKQSPLALDLYLWLTYRASYLKEPVGIAWGQLHSQLGAEYTDPKEFAREVRRQLRRIKALWPGLSYATPRGRLVLHPSEPSVPKLKA